MAEAFVIAATQSREMKVTGIQIYRDGGTIEFQIEDHPAHGLYRLTSPLLDPNRSLHRLEPTNHAGNRDGERGERPWFDGPAETLIPGGADEYAVLSVLEEWLRGEITPECAALLEELRAMPLWQNLPDRLDRAVPLRRIEIVTDVLRTRADCQQ